jgi:hypothetical protein
VIVTFLPTRTGTYSSGLRVLLSNGDTLAPIPQTASARSLGWPQIETKRVDTDTIGGDVYVPIVVPDRGAAGDLAFHVAFDTTSLVYVGAYAGDQVDATTLQHPGDVHVRFSDLQRSTDTVIGYLHFRVYPRRTACTDLTIDSIQFNAASAQCVLTLPTYVTQVCWGASCDAPLLSDFVRYGSPPRFTIKPNPATDVLEIDAMQSVSDAALTVTDVTGRTVLSQTVSISRGTPMRLDLRSLRDGVYLLNIAMGRAGHRERFVVER